MARLEVVKGVASQRIYFYPPQGRPTATPSVSIKDDAGTTITAAATTYTTLDSVNTTVSTAGAVGDSSLVLTSITGIAPPTAADPRGGTYLLTNSLQQQEWVRVRSVNSSTKTVGFDEPLQYAHDTAATFVGTRFYRTLQTAEADELVELYRARATYVVGGLNYVLEVPFDVVLTPLPNPLTVEFVKRRRADIMAYQPSETRGDDLLDMREAAWDEVLKGIREQSTASGSMRPALIRTPEDVDKWALAEFDLLAQRNGLQVLKGWDPERALLWLEGERNKRRESCLATLNFYDQDEDDSKSDDEEKPLGMDLVR